MSRKKQLFDRAIAYGNKLDEFATVKEKWIAAGGFEAGYRAAMRDLRKVRTTAAKTASLRGADVANNVLRSMLEWLRPLR